MLAVLILPNPNTTVRMLAVLILLPDFALLSLSRQHTIFFGLILRCGVSRASVVELAFFPLVNQIPASLPFKRQWLDTRSGHGVKSAQCLSDKIYLILLVAEFSRFKAKRVVHKLRPWWLTGLQDIKAASQNERG